MLYKKENITKSLVISQTVGINLDIKQKLNVGLNATLAYNNVSYSVQTGVNSLDQKYYTQTYTTDISYMGLKGWVMSTDFDYIVNTGRGEGSNLS